MAEVFLSLGHTSLGPKFGNVVSHRFFTVAIRIKYTWNTARKDLAVGQTQRGGFYITKVIRYKTKCHPLEKIMG